eukprot:4309148-Prymnesium_polylepis.1
MHHATQRTRLEAVQLRLRLPSEHAQPHRDRLDALLRHTLQGKRKSTPLVSTAMQHVKGQRAQLTTHSSPVPPCSLASSTANGSHIAPSSPLLDVSASTHSASSKSAGCTTAPSRMKRTCSCAAAASLPTHACASVR